MAPYDSRAAHTRGAAARRKWLAANPGNCQMIMGCMNKANTVDHIIPLSTLKKARSQEEYERLFKQLEQPGNYRRACEHHNKSHGAKLGNKQRANAKRKTQTKTDFLEKPDNSAHNSSVPPLKRSRKPREKAGVTLIPFGGNQSEKAVLEDSGMVRPRFETPRQPGVKSLGPEVVDLVNKSGVLGRWELLPWQIYVLDRALELRDDGSLRWATVVVTVARQQGKSVLLRSLAWWRMQQGQRFDEEQLVISVSNLARTAREIWQPAARVAVAQFGKTAAKYGKGAEEIDLREQGLGRWVLQAADENAGIGYSPTLALIDEAWNVPQGVYDDGLGPALSERNQPQAWLFSTAGDSSSNLLRYYREIALQDRDGSGDVLLLEWSAPEHLPYDNPDTWRWASPHWSDRREAFLKSKLAIPESKFRTQYCNQWVTAVDGWIPSAKWSASFGDVVKDGVPEVVTVEVSQDGQRFGAVAGWRVGDQAHIESFVTASTSQLWAKIEEWNPRKLLLVPALHIHFQGNRPAIMVGSMELQKHMVGVARAIGENRVVHSVDDHLLNADVGCAVAVSTDAGLRLSVKKSTGPTEAARAMIHTVGEILKPGARKPVIRSK